MRNFGAVFLALSTILILSAVSSTSGFAIVGTSLSARCPIDYTISRRQQCTDKKKILSIRTAFSSLFASPANTEISSRRNFLGRTISSATASLTIIELFSPQTATAKEVEIVTRQTVSDAFNAIRDELSSPTGVVSTLTNLIEHNSCPEIMQYTKESDAYFRKAKLGKARKLLTDNALKGDAILMSNAVTFDLIGINRASRPGQENKEEQLKYLEELKKDIQRFLELENTIVVIGE